MIRPATASDLPRLQQIYAAARQYMRRSGNPTQWSGGYPADEVLLQDIREGRLYVMEQDGTSYACFMLCDGPDPTYAKIYDGAWASDTSYGVIHRVASDGSVSGVLGRCVAYARQQYGHLRIDTHRDNLPMQRALRAAGFVHRGTIFLANGDPRLAYDWVGQQ